MNTNIKKTGIAFAAFLLSVNVQAAASPEATDRYATLSIAVRPTPETAAVIKGFIDSCKKEAHKKKPATSVITYASPQTYHLTVEQFSPPTAHNPKPLTREHVEGAKDMMDFFSAIRKEPSGGVGVGSNPGTYEGSFYDIQLWCHFTDDSGQKQHVYFSANERPSDTVRPISKLGEFFPKGVPYASLALRHGTAKGTPRGLFPTDWEQIIVSTDPDEIGFGRNVQELKSYSVAHDKLRSHITIANLTEGKTAWYPTDFLTSYYMAFYNNFKAQFPKVVGKRLGIPMDITELRLETIIKTGQGVKGKKQQHQRVSVMGPNDPTKPIIVKL